MDFETGFILGNISRILEQADVEHEVADDGTLSVGNLILTSRVEEDVTFSDDEIRTLRQLLSVVALCPKAYALGDRLDRIFGDLPEEDIFYYTIDKDRSGESAVLPLDKVNQSV